MSDRASVVFAGLLFMLASGLSFFDLYQFASLIAR